MSTGLEFGNELLDASSLMNLKRGEFMGEIKKKLLGSLPDALNYIYGEGNTTLGETINPQQIHSIINDGEFKAPLEWLWSKFKGVEASSLSQYEATFLTKTLPKLLLFASPSKKEEGGNAAQEPKAFIEFLNKVTESLAQGNPINIISQMCPPYNYELHHEDMKGRNGTGILSGGQPVKHFDNSLLDTIGGYKFDKFIRTIEYIFSDLADESGKLPVNLEFITYTGQGTIDELIDIDPEKKAFYRQRGSPENILYPLQQAANEAGEIISAHLSRFYGIKLSSFEVDFRIDGRNKILDQADKIMEYLGKPDLEDKSRSILDHIYADLTILLRTDTHDLYHHIEEITLPHIPDVHGLGEYLQKIFGWNNVINAINHFFINEIKFRAKNRMPIDGSLLKTTILEALLYLNLQQYALDKDAVLFPAETTADYSNDLLVLRHKKGSDAKVLGSIFPRGGAWASALQVRQPFNPPLLTQFEAERTIYAANGMSIEQMVGQGLIRLKN